MDLARDCEMDAHGEVGLDSWRRSGTPLADTGVREKSGVPDSARGFGADTEAGEEGVAEREVLLLCCVDRQISPRPIGNGERGIG